MTCSKHRAKALFQLLSHVPLNPSSRALPRWPLSEQVWEACCVHLEEEIMKAPSPQQHHKAKTALLLQCLPSPPGTSTPGSRGLAV